MEILSQLYLQFTSMLPHLMAAIVVLGIGIFIAKTVAKVVGKLLMASGIDSLGDKLNDIDIVQKFNVKVAISGMVSKILYYIILLIFIIAATDILAMPAISKLVSDIINYVPLLITAGLVLMLGTMLADVIKSVVLTTCRSLGIASGNVIANVVFYFIFINAIVVALSQAQIDTGFIKNNLTVLLGAIAGAFALGYGLASKDLMSSFLASFYHRDRFDVGDTITIDGVTGEIVEMDNACIVIQNEGKRIIIPSSKLHSHKVEIHDQKMLR